MEQGTVLSTVISTVLLLAAKKDSFVSLVILGEVNVNPRILMVQDCSQMVLSQNFRCCINNNI